MAMQTGVSSSKVLLLVGAGLTGSVIIRHGRLSDVIAQLQDLLGDVNGAKISPEKYDTALLAAQIRQLAHEIRELSTSNPITILNGNSSSSGITNYIVPAAAVGAMGYCYMWWKGWSFSDVMYVTKQNMKTAVESVSKQLENVSEAVATTRKQLSKKLENLDWRVEEQRQLTDKISDNVTTVSVNLSQIGNDVEMIQRMVAGLEVKLEVLEGKQDLTNSGLWYLCQTAEGFKDGSETIALEGATSRVAIADNPPPSSLRYVDKWNKGLQFIVEKKEQNEMTKTTLNTKKVGVDDYAVDKISSATRIHRSYTVGLSSMTGLQGC
uniref:DUF1664 domain-containing protein n=1 Tax=Kalanchoe fedtschenkoi TaxID=63787 RepID=A0A7N0TBI2_KALFE